MTSKEFESLERGDIIRHFSEADSYVVTDRRVTSDGFTYYVIVRTSEASNPDEWVKVK